MSTIPTEILETTAATIAETVAQTIAPTVAPAIAASSEAVDSGLDFSQIKKIMDGFDPAALLPEMAEVFGDIAAICRVAVMIGPIVILIMGLCYLFLAPKEANWYFGYRTYFGMGSINAWQYTQRLAGVVFTSLGLGLTIVMFLLSAPFDGMDVMDMAWKAVFYLAWQAGLVLLATLFVNLAAAYRFDRKGSFRRKRR